MLVLSRKRDDEIRIELSPGVIACVRVLSIHAGRVRLGITAPDGVRTDRGEVAAKREAKQ